MAATIVAWAYFGGDVFSSSAIGVFNYFHGIFRELGISGNSMGISGNSRNSGNSMEFIGKFQGNSREIPGNSREIPGNFLGILEFPGIRESRNSRDPGIPRECPGEFREIPWHSREIPGNFQ